MLKTKNHELKQNKYTLIAKLILIIMSALLVLSLITNIFSNDLVAHANTVDNGYVIKHQDVQMIVNLDNSYTIKETLTVSFGSLHAYGESRGIYRYIPLSATMKNDLGGRNSTITYNAKINMHEAKIVETGKTPESITTKDNHLVVLLRDNQLVNGQTRSYYFHYTYSVGYDRVEQLDILYYNLLGTQTNTSVENFTFSIVMPTPNTEIEPIFYTGKYGEATNSVIVSDIETYEDENQNQMTRIYGHSVGALSAFEGVTVKVNLPNNYFSEVKKFSIWLDIAILIASLAIIGGIIFYFSNKLDKQKPVQVVEFYPPDDIDPIKLIYSLKGSISTKDMVSLIVYFASKGYLYIIDEKPKTYLIKLKDLDNSAPQYQKVFFESLFSKPHAKEISDNNYNKLLESYSHISKDIKKEDLQQVDIKTINGAVAKDIYSAITIAKFEFDKRVETKKTSSSLVMRLLSLIPFTLFATTYLIRVSSTNFFKYGLIPIIWFAALSVISYIAFNQTTFTSQRNKIFSKLVSFVVIAIGIIIMPYVFSESIVDKLYLSVITTVIISIGAILASIYPTLNSTYKPLYGRVIGFRKHLIVAEENRMKVLLKDNPSYFYDILPYAYVLGITNEFIKQFEGLTVEAPQWYSSTQLSVFDLYVFSRIMNTSLYTMRQNFIINQNPTTSGRGIGGFGGGFGGGGFSGGGFGGGGIGRA